MKVVIIGAGPAGTTVAETLRRYDRQAEVVLLSGEPYPPYAPPAMIEYFLTGREVHFWKGEDFPQRLGLDWHPATPVSQVRPEEQVIVTAAGERIGYDKLVIASGSRLYAPLVGVDKPGIYNFKSLRAAEALVEKVREGTAKSALIVGAGFIGMEIALLLREMGLKVTQVEMTDRVMPRMLDAETAEIALGIMQERGIEVRLNTKARAFLGEERAEAVELESGEVLTADLLIAATGVKPNIEFLEGSGIETRWGVLVDDHLRTNLPDIYAAGDVAETIDRITGERYVHAIFPNAVAQGRVVAYNLLGWDVPYEGADSMNSLKHLGLPIMAVGQMEGEERRLRRGDVLRKIYLQDHRIVGFRLVGDVSAAGIYRWLMHKRVDVRPFERHLLEPSFGMGLLESLALSPDLVS
ncbi:MAG: NAD(P)/FAD-dependent oxidoreductase [Chloroflexia bacterium]